jgi:hypothetical protein
MGFDRAVRRRFPEGGEPLRFAVSAASGAEVLEAVAAATGAFFVPLQPGRLLAAKDSNRKRQELEPSNTVK